VWVSAETGKSEALPEAIKQKLSEIKVAKRQARTAKV